MSQTPPDEPLRQFDATGKLRWRAVTPAHDRVSPCWTLSVRGRDVYLAQRGMPDVKISLHESGDAFLTFVDHEKAEKWGWSGPSRRLSQWHTRSEFHPGWARLLHVIHPESELRQFNEAGLEGLDFVDLEVGPDTALHVCLLRNIRAPVATQVSFSKAVHLANFHDGEDWKLDVMAILEPWPSHMRQWASNARLADPGGHDRSIASPTLNRDSPASRLVKLVTDADGGESIYDLAANEPPPVET